MKAWLDLVLARMPRLYGGFLRASRPVERDRRTLLALVRRRDVVLDVGANAGTYTVLLSNLVGRRGRVHAFEPVPPTFAALAARVARQRCFDNVALNDCALAASDGPLRLYVPGTDFDQAAIAYHDTGSWQHADEVVSYTSRATTLDAYLAAHGDALPAFMKCAVEGAELRVLEGAAATLRRAAPLLQLAINPDWTRNLGYRPPDLVRFLTGYGYSRFYLMSEAPHLLADPLRELAGLRGAASLVCAVAGRHDDRLRRLPQRWRRGTGAAAVR
jgi:FkbM family methyltransferase